MASNMFSMALALLALGVPVAEAEIARAALITSAPLLAPRQQDQCARATDTVCPDGNGCCPSGAACTYTRNSVPICDQACGILAITCSSGLASGFCCAAGFTCGPSLCETAPGGIATGFPAPVSIPTFRPVPSGILTPNEPSIGAATSTPTFAPLAFSSSATPTGVTIGPAGTLSPEESSVVGIGPGALSSTSSQILISSSESTTSSQRSSAASPDGQTTTTRPATSQPQGQAGSGQSSTTTTAGAVHMANNMGSYPVELIGGAVAWLAALVL